MDIKSRIDRAMQIARIKSQAELARRSGLPGTTIARLLKQGGNPSADTLQALAKTLNVSMDWIVTGEDHKQNQVPRNLVYLTDEELGLITDAREATSLGRKLILETAKNVPKKKLDSDEPQL